MTVSGLVPAIERQEGLDPIADGVRGVVQCFLSAAGPAGRVIANGLYGVWLKHPLHPAITDIPVGAWTAALVLDVLDTRTMRREPGGPGAKERSDLGRGADVAIAVGLAGALGAAASGTADWQHEHGSTARIGLVHGLLNASATALYATSLLLRAGGKRTAGHTCALAGYGLVLAGGYLGGELVFQDRLGVDRTAGLAMPKEFTPVLDDAELAEGAMQRVRIKGTPLLLVRQDGQVYAMVERCSHRGGPLSEGVLEAGCVVCPWHGSRFALVNGAVIDGPATFPQPSLETRVHEGKIEVRGTLAATG